MLDGNNRESFIHSSAANLSFYTFGPFDPFDPSCVVVTLEVGLDLKADLIGIHMVASRIICFHVAVSLPTREGDSIQ